MSTQADVTAQERLEDTGAGRCCARRNSVICGKVIAVRGLYWCACGDHLSEIGWCAEHLATYHAKAFRCRFCYEAGQLFCPISFVQTWPST